MESTYKPGLHIIADFTKVDSYKLTNMKEFQQLVYQLINQLNLVKVGEVFYAFDNGGYTATICLTESHISIHTWPEFGRLTFDVFLSNFQHRNEDKVRLIYEEVRSFFQPIGIQITEVNR